MSEVMFSIQLRISTEKIDLPIYRRDNNQTILDRLCKNQMIQKEFRKLLSERLNESMMGILGRRDLGEELRGKVRKFLEQDRDGGRGKGREDGERREERGKWEEKEGRKNENRQNRYGEGYDFKDESEAIIEKYRNKKNYFKQQEMINDINSSPYVKKINNQSEYTNQNNIISTPTTYEPTYVDDDIIQAYQTVYSKCKDPELKIMMQNSLKSFQTPQQPQVASPHYTKSITDYSVFQPRPQKSIKTQSSIPRKSSWISTVNFSKNQPISPKQRPKNSRLLQQIPQTRFNQTYNFGNNPQHSRSKSRSKRYNYLQNDTQY